MRAARTALPKGVDGSLESFAVVPKLTGLFVAKKTAATNSATVFAFLSDPVLLVSSTSDALKKPIFCFKVSLSSPIWLRKSNPCSFNVVRR